MRTLQEKYNGINEGKFSKDQFLRDARLQLPNLVTQYNGYDDAVKILKNRGMIQEAVSTEETYADYSDDALTDMIMNLSRFDGNEDIIARVKAELARRKGALNEAVNMTLEPGDVFRNVSSKVMLKPNHNYEITSANEFVIKFKDQDYPKQTGTVQLDKFNELVEKGDIIVFPKKTTSFSKELNEANQLKTTKKGLTDYRYKPTNDMDKYPYEQILRGLRVELEGLSVLGTPTPEEYQKALAKVLRNLEKDSIYYTNQVAGVKAKAKRTDVMVDATPKNEVDKENGLQKAALKEAIKGVIKNILSEDLDPDLYDQDEEREERKSRYGQSEFGDGEDIYEMQGPKSDQEYKSELADYLDDNGIFGYTDRIHNIMTGPDEAENADELVRFLEDNQIYGYGRGIERIYADYPYDQHWMNQPDEDEEEDDIPHPFGYEEASDEESFEDLFETTDTEADKAMVRKFMTMYETEPSKFERLHKQAQVQAKTNSDIKYKHLLSLLDRAKAGALQSLANQDRYQASIEGMDESVSLKDLL